MTNTKRSELIDEKIISKKTEGLSYAWRPVTEKEKEEIKTNSKKLLDEFSSKLSKIRTCEPKLDSKENLRTEGSGSNPNSEFREYMMDNAPMVEDGLIIAETGSWKK